MSCVSTQDVSRCLQNTCCGPAADAGAGSRPAETCSSPDRPAHVDRRDYTLPSLQHQVVKLDKGKRPRLSQQSWGLDSCEVCIPLATARQCLLALNRLQASLTPEEAAAAKALELVAEAATSNSRRAGEECDFPADGKEHDDLQSCKNEGVTTSLAVQRIMTKLTSWEEFNVFELYCATQGRPLEAVALTLFHRLGLIASLKIDVACLQAFLQEIESKYNNNPYHNRTHAADVTQTMGVLLLEDEFHKQFSDLELLTCLMSAIIHDLAHPGVTNDFLIKSRDPAAILYNDRSPNENTHVSLAFQVLMKPHNNFLEQLPEPDYAALRAMVIAVVLATDITRHRKLLETFLTCTSQLGNNLRNWPQECRAVLLRVMLHCCDIANPAKPLALSLRWTERIMEESWAQGDREKQLGLQVSPLCDRESVDVAQSQLSFLEHFVKPSFLALESLLPKTSSRALQYIEQNCEHWQKSVLKHNFAGRQQQAAP